MFLTNNVNKMFFKCLLNRLLIITFDYILTIKTKKYAKNL